MKRLAVLITLLIAIATTVPAQPSYYKRNKKFTVSGQIKDYNDKQPVPYCPVIIKNKKDSTVAFSLTDKKGFFSIPVHPGRYNVIIRFMGYQTDTIPLKITDKDKTLGIIRLKHQTNTLKTVVVKESSVKNLIDKDEVIVTEKLKAGAATATDVLDRINGISYDRYDDKIEVDNSENVIFMVNGLEKDAEYIKNMNPNRIEKVEIIRDPGGRYGLEGYTAIINIVLKENYVGHELTLASMGTIDPDTKDKDYMFPMNGGRISYNYSAKKTNLYLQARAFRMEAGVFKTVIRTTDSSLINMIPQDFNKYNSAFIMKRIRFVGGLDYRINPVHTLSFESSYGITPPTDNFGNYLNQYFMDDTLVSESYYNSTSHTEGNNFSSKLFYVGNYSEKSSVNSDLRFSYSSNQTSSTYSYSPPGWILGTDMNSSTKTIMYNVDWTYTPLENWGFQIGYGNVYSLMESETKMMSALNSNSSSYIDFRNRLFAYNTLAINEKLTLKAGLAFELSTPTVSDTTYQFNIWQPYVDAQYKISKMFNIKFKYRTKSIYPTVNQVNPYPVSYDGMHITEGNPELKPATINKTSLKFNVLGGMMYLETYYNFSNGYIAQLIKKKENGTLIYTYDNVGFFGEYGIKTSFTVPFGKKIFWRNNIKIFNSEMSYQDYDNAFTDWGGSSNLMYMWKEKNLILGLMYQRKMYKHITLQGYTMSRSNFWGLMFQKSFLKKRLNVMAFYMLPIDLLIDYDRVNYSETPFYTEKEISDASSVKNIFFMRISYNISKGHVIKKKRESDDNMNEFNLF